MTNILTNNAGHDWAQVTKSLHAQIQQADSVTGRWAVRPARRLGLWQTLAAERRRESCVWLLLAGASLAVVTVALTWPVWP